ncbi:MAG: N-acetylmuramoyl-L-alanine amidase family protein, partial [Eggerthella sp.]|nr:N-acetylmuramoyl-L-alanine amidase family protein [Eggerthella sp.]
RYYVDGKGVMKTGWIKADEGWYYANKSGAVNQNGWVRSGSKWYWLQGDKQGLMAADQWITDKNKRYYLSGSGAMATKWIHTGDDWYYANKSGAQQNGWVKSGGKWYWLQADKQGLMAANENLTISGALYSFTDSGAMRANTTVDLENSKVGYATSSGAIVAVGTKENGKLVLRNAQGAPLTGWQKFGGAWFYGDEGGVAHTGWLALKGKKYWLDDNGVMATGLRTIDGKRYVFSPSGAYVPVSAAHAAVFERAVKELERCTNASMTKEQKLRAAFNHIRDDFREYNPRIPHMKRVGWETIYADDVFIGRGGNCLSYAAAFAFMAKAIGYENVYACNRCHAWVEIYGRVYDPEWEKNHRSENYFNRAINASGGPGYTNKQGEPWMRVAI